MIESPTGRRLAHWGHPGDVATALGRLLCPPGLVALDIETVSLKDRRIIGFGVAVGPDEAYYVPLLPDYSPYVYDVVERVVCNPDVVKVYHNGMFDLLELMEWGADTSNVVDTKIMASLLGLPQGLKELWDALGDGQLVMDRSNLMEISDIIPKRGTMLDVPYGVVASKCLGDVLATYRCYERMQPYVDRAYLQSEMELLPLLLRISKRGIRLDQAVVKALDVKYRQEVDFYRSVAEAEGFNPASPEQVGYVLMQRGCKLPVHRQVNKKTGKVKWVADTGEEILRGLDDEWAALVLNFRVVSKLHSTYVEPYLGQDRAFTTLYQGPVTGRLASKDRNLQNIPASRDGTPSEMRGMFVPDSDVFTSFDFSQQELRTLAYVSQDPDMLRVYEQGLDIHQDTADFMGIQRKVAKNVTFAMVYGGDPQTIMETAGISSLQRAKDLRQAWFEHYSKAGAWIERTAEEGLAAGKVRTIGGRWIYLDNLEQEDEAGVRRKAVNYVIQGSAAELTKKAMLLCQHLDVALQVHDELIVDGRVEEEELRELGVEEVGPFHCPIGAKYMRRWE